MDDKKIIKIHNKSDKPDNIVFRDNELIEKCIKVENKLPKFMKNSLLLDILSLIFILVIIYLAFKFEFWRYFVWIILSL